MEPGNVVLTPSVWHHKFDAEGREEARISYKPIRKTETFVMLSLGVMRKGDHPAEHAMRALQELGWTPPAESGAKGSERSDEGNLPPDDQLRGALRPFYDWAKDNIAAEEGGSYIWSGLGCQNERIRVWFGPSEFGRLAEVFAALPPPGGGNGADSTERAARIASDHAATAPQRKSEGEA